MITSFPSEVFKLQDNRNWVFFFSTTEINWRVFNEWLACVTGAEWRGKGHLWYGGVGGGGERRAIRAWLITGFTNPILVSVYSKHNIFFRILKSAPCFHFWQNSMYVFVLLKVINIYLLHTIPCYPDTRWYVRKSIIRGCFLGCLQFSQKNPEISVERQSNDNCPENSSRGTALLWTGNFGTPLLGTGNFLLFLILQFLVSPQSKTITRNSKWYLISAIPFNKLVDFRKTVTSIQRSSQTVPSDKW